MLEHRTIPDSDGSRYPPHEGPEQALQAALAFWDNPPLSGPTSQSLVQFGRDVEGVIKEDWETVTYRILRQNSLRVLIACSPDLQTS
jgi:hypothetical protein